MRNKAVFLDRDGIINVDKGYVGKIADFEFVSGIFSLIKAFEKSGYLPIIVTNQSGIGRGYYSEKAFSELSDWMNARFESNGIGPVPVYYCPHHPTDAVGDYRMDCRCRKPQPGLLIQAAEDCDIDLTQSVMIGDSLRDMEAAEAAGVPIRVWVTEQAKHNQIASSCTHTAANLSDIEPLLLVGS